MCVIVYVCVRVIVCCAGVRADDEVIKALQAFRDDAEAVWYVI